ncbi:trypsin-like peptidase domain-containing protein [Streptomyces sp. NPDC002787]
MNEGKPTKAKWWSRPRAHGAGAGTTGDHTEVPEDAVGGPNSEGDFELERPASAPATRSADTAADTDFELARPAAEAPHRSGSTPVPDTNGDFELERPALTEEGRGAAAGASHGAVLAEAADGVAQGAATAEAARHGDGAAMPTNADGGDPRTADAGDARGAGASPPASDEVTARLGLEKSATGAAAVSQAAVARRAGEPGGSGSAAVAATAVAATAVAEAQLSGEPGALSAAGGLSERPKPLHDPDPYSTPPYGEPGPWAPAPPVQHPATTPAHGTHVDAPSVGVPTHAGETAAGALAHSGPPSASTSTPLAEAASAAPPPSSVTPAHGTAVPPTVPQPTAAAGQPGVAPEPEQPQVAPQPPGASYAYPSQPGPPPFGEAARAAATPYAEGAQPPSAGYADASRAVPQTSPGPWQNYDPWAGSGSLQQNGAAVGGVARRRGRRGKGLLAGALLIALVAGGVGGVVGAYLERNGGVGEVELPQAADGVTGRAPDSVAGIAASALPSVVTLHVSGSSAQGTGTGFVLDERGHILTNNHVVDPAGTSGDISVTFSGGETAKATIVGRDTGYDLAVVKVSGVSGLKPLTLGNSEQVQVGDPVVAIGAPFDLANTVTSGIISAKERPITAGGVSDVSYVDALQTDAPINPGNSGGPLLDGKGRVIGINSAIRSAGSGSESDGGQAGSIGLGFAIPINQGKRVAEELINTGKATHPVIGVTLDMDYSGDGARIGEEGSGGGSAVTEGGPADRAGIRSGDVVTEVDGQRVHSGDELIVKVRAHRPGDRLELTLQRNGEEQTVTLTLGSSGD